MEDFIDPFLEPSSWADMSSSLKSYRGDDKSPPICMISSNMEDVDLYGHDDGNSPFFIDANLKYGISKDLFSGESLLHHDNNTHDDSFSLECMIKNNSTGGSFGSELNTTCSVTLPRNSLSVTSSIESNGSEPSGFPPSLGDAHSISSAMWPSSYSDVSFMGQGKLHGFGFEDLGNDGEILKKTPVVRGTYSTLDSLPGASLQDQNELRNSQISYFGSSFKPHQQEQNGTSNIQLPFLSAGSQILLSKGAGMQTHQQPTQGNTTKHQTNNSSGNQSHLPPSNTTASNGDAKPRVRARRGQATDPHSIAERLRREKIAERMKNLQELVPNSNKTDKASMLDEIIDYVRFLQLQVKVLSMSRLGAAGAVVPLITDSQSELSSNPFQSPSGGKRVSDLSELEDNLAFEEEVVKLMESNVTTAMQFLQNKGLCLMPIALASAISTQKGTSAAMDRRTLCVVERNGMEDNGAIKNEEALNSLGN